MRKLVVVLAVVALAVLAITGTALARSTTAPASDRMLAAATPQVDATKAWLGIAVANLNSAIAQRFNLSQHIPASFLATATRAIFALDRFRIRV